MHIKGTYRTLTTRQYFQTYCWRALRLVGTSPMLQACCRRAVLYAWARPACTPNNVYEGSALRSWCFRTRIYHASTHRSEQDSPALRKQLKDAAKVRKAGLNRSKSSSPEVAIKAARWELTVGIEIHAQLNTTRKLFSSTLDPACVRMTADWQQMLPRRSQMSPMSK
jgi:hypothetical protein